MRALLSVWYASLVIVAGCSSGPTDPGAPADPKGWTITVDLSATDRFVAPETSASWRIAGRATATEGLAEVTVAGRPAPLAGDAFEAMVDVAPGLTRVPILARDLAGHERQADRTLLAARFLPAGQANGAAASMVLDNAILAAMSGGIAGQAGNIDVAGEILAREVLSQDDRCITWPEAASQGAVQVTLSQSAGDLWLNIKIPSLYVYFEGRCQGVLSQIPIAGEFGGTIDVWTKLGAAAPGQPCLTSFTHTTPTATVLNWGFDVWGTGGPLQNWIIQLFQGEKASEAKAMIAGEVKTRADQLLGEKLANIQVLDRTSELEMLGRPVSMHLCLGNLEKIGGKLVARVAASADSAGSREAPGAPQLDGPIPAAAARELVLDANLIGQLLFASWRDGGLARPGPDAPLGVLQALMPDLAARWPNATVGQVAIDAELPPLVRATPDGPGDLSIELGDLAVEISIEGTRVLRFGVGLTLLLELVPEDGKLSPKVKDVRSEVALLDELYDGPDAALAQAVSVQLAGAAAELLGAGAAIALPDLPGLGTPMDVVPDAGGRFMRVKLAP